jgi:protein disulfide-isomerase A1
MSFPRSLFLFACLSLALFVYCDEEAVITLTANNFDQTIEENEFILVEFYAPWCGHCKRLAPEYENAAKELKELNIRIAKIDADSEINRELAQKYEIRGFPTIKLFRKDAPPKDYQGGRTASDIVSFMKKQSLPSISNIDNPAKLAEFSQSDQVVIVGFFPDTQSTQYSNFQSTANALRESYVFGQVIGNEALAQVEGAEQTPAVILYKKFDERKNILTDLSDIPTFVNTHSIPLVAEIGPENYRTYVESGLPLAYLFVDLKVEGQKDENIEKIKDVAKQSKGKINFVFIDWTKYSKHSERLGLSGQTVPAFAIEEEAGSLHYAYPEDAPFTQEGLTKFVESFLAKELQPTIKSEPIPVENNGPVTVLVAKNFDDIVKDSTKDVLVEFYAPWCGHCKKLAPTYEDLGKAFEKVDSVVIAKIDATANDVDPKLGIRGFPTLKFFPANDKTPVDYEGDRSLEDLKKFVQEKASIKFSLNPKEEL